MSQVSLPPPKIAFKTRHSKTGRSLPIGKLPRGGFPGRDNRRHGRDLRTTASFRGNEPPANHRRIYGFPSRSLPGIIICVPPSAVPNRLKKIANASKAYPQKTGDEAAIPCARAMTIPTGPDTENRVPAQPRTGSPRCHRAPAINRDRECRNSPSSACRFRDNPASHKPFSRPGKRRQRVSGIGENAFRYGKPALGPLPRDAEGQTADREKLALERPQNGHRQARHRACTADDGNILRLRLRIEGCNARSSVRSA